MTHAGDDDQAPARDPDPPCPVRTGDLCKLCVPGATGPESEDPAADTLADIDEGLPPAGKGDAEAEFVITVKRLKLQPKQADGSSWDSWSAGDPAVCIGHREVDVAMSELFGGFPTGFLEAYHEAFPLDADYRHVRRPLYQLYYLLVHLNLFGGSYLGGVRNAAAKVLGAL